MRVRAYLGIDPGKTGGVAYLTTADGYCEAIPMPMEEPDGRNYARIDVPCLVRWLQVCKKIAPIKMVALERNWARPGQGVSSMFTFGDVSGEVRGVIRALNLPLIEVTPRQWQKVVLIGDNPDIKAAALEFVKAQYPLTCISVKQKRGKIVPHSGMADAVCLAHFASMYNELS